VSDDADVRLVDLRTDGPVSFAVEHAGERVDVRLPIPGAHNALNATGAMAVLLSLGWRLDGAARAVGGFTGTVRRFEHKHLGSVRLKLHLIQSHLTPKGPIYRSIHTF